MLKSMIHPDRVCSGRSTAFLLTAILIVFQSIAGIADAQELVVVRGPDGLYGAAEHDGTLRIPHQFTSMRRFSSGLAPATKDTGRVRQWGVIDESGEWVLEPRFVKVGAFERGMTAAREQPAQSLASDKFVVLTALEDQGDIHVSRPISGRPVANSDQRIIVFSETESDGRQFGIVGPRGRMIVEPKRGDGIGIVRPFDGSFASARNEDEGRDAKAWGFIDRQGHWIVEPQFTASAGVGAGMGTVQVPSTDSPGTPDWAYVYLNGEREISTNYDWVHPFREGLARVSSDLLYGYIDQQGRWRVKPTFVEAGDFSEGLAAVTSGERPNLRWGYIDHGGQWVIKPRFDNAEAFDGGLARVEQGDRSGLIDRTGQWWWIDGRGYVGD